MLGFENDQYKCYVSSRSSSAIFIRGTHFVLIIGAPLYHSNYPLSISSFSRVALGITTEIHVRTGQRLTFLAPEGWLGKKRLVIVQSSVDIIIEERWK